MVDNQNLRKIPQLWASEFLPIKFDYLTLPDSSNELSHRCGTNFADYKILLENYLLTITNILISIQTQVPQKKKNGGEGVGEGWHATAEARKGIMFPGVGVTGHLTWTLRTKLRSTGWNPVSLCTVSPAPICLFLRQSWYVSIQVIRSTWITDEQPHSPWELLFPSTTQAIDCYMLLKIENLVGDLAQW